MQSINEVVGNSVSIPLLTFGCSSDTNLLSFQVYNLGPWCALSVLWKLFLKRHGQRHRSDLCLQLEPSWRHKDKVEPTKNKIRFNVSQQKINQYIYNIVHWDFKFHGLTRFQFSVLQIWEMTTMECFCAEISEMNTNKENENCI